MELEFYVLDASYEVVGPEPHVIIWGISRNGERILLRDKRFRPYFYAIIKDGVDVEQLVKKVKTLSEASSPITDVEHVKRNFLGRPVNALRITTIMPDSVRRYREKVKKLSEIEDVVEADIRFSMRYILDHDIHPSGWHRAEVKEVPVKPIYRVSREYEVTGDIEYLDEPRPPEDLRVMAFDIEVCSASGSPKPERDPVIIIGVSDGNGNVIQFAGDDDKKNITDFYNYVIEKDPDIIAGYNSNHFDWLYLIDRSRHLGIKFDIGRRKDVLPSPSTYGHISIPGRLSLDLYNYAEEIPEIKLKSLDVVADYLGVMKRSERTLIDYMEFPKYWGDQSKRYLLLKYNKEDVISTEGLAQKFLPFALQLSNLTRMPLDQVGAASVGYRLEWFLMFEAYKAGELIPNRLEEEYAETYKGAVVIQPSPGIHEDVAVLDFTSMYPNIMIKYNVGPDTIVVNEPCDPGEHNIAPEVGHCFRREPQGFFKNVLVKLLELRKALRQELRKYQPGTPEYIIIDERQKAIKILANATYGYMGWIGARWYCKSCAEAVTAWGRKTILTAIDIARSLGLKVMYGDTDSLFVEAVPGKVEELVRRITEELGFEIKIDKVYKRIFFTEAKKRYAGLLEDGRIDIVGFEAVRGDWAEIAKEVQETVTEILLREEDVNKAVEYVRNIIGMLNEGKIPIEKLVIWKTLTKPLEEYEAEAPHVSVARKLTRKGIKIGVGDKIGYVVVKGSGKVSDRAEPYQFVKDPKLVDTAYYIDRQIVPAAHRILEYFGVSEDELKKVAVGAGRKRLTDYFGKG